MSPNGFRQSRTAAIRALFDKARAALVPATPFEHLVNSSYEGDGTEGSPFQITWSGADDIEDPQTFSKLYKWILASFVSFATLGISLASSALSGPQPSIQNQLGGSTELLTLNVSLYVLGFAFGPLFWAPASEVFGRRAIFLVSFAVFTVSSALGSASPHLAMLFVMRFIGGLSGSSPLTNAGGTIADVFEAKDRGLAMAIFAAVGLTGPAVGPIAGGFIGEKAGFRWIMAFTAFYGAFATFLGYFIHRETYGPLLLRRRAKKLAQATGKSYISKLDVGKDVTLRHELKIALTRPWLLLIHEPIVLLFSLYIALIFAILYSFFEAFPIVYGHLRGWSTGSTGLAFLGILLGAIIALAIQVFIVNPAYKKTVDRHGGSAAPPEARLPQAMWAGVLLVIGLAGFAATDATSVHWIVPIGFSVPFGAAMIMSFISTQSYLVDSYVIYAASVLATTALLRSLAGAAFPLFTPYMYYPGGSHGHCQMAPCGIHIGPAIAAVLAVVFVPAPFYFYRHGASIRRRCLYSAEAARILESAHAPSDGSSDSRRTGEKTASGEEQP